MASNNFCILRFQKIKSAIAVRRALKHNSRINQPENANHEKSDLNQYFNSYDEALEIYKKQLPEKVRKNAVHAVEILITASPEILQKMTFQEQKNYFNQSLAWAEKQLGGRENLLSACIHRDEATPHLHMIFMPLKEKKLNANYYIGGSKHKMIELQDDFYKNVGQKFKMGRGRPAAITKAKHLNSRDYLAKKGQELADKEKQLNAKQEALLKYSNALSKVQKKELKKALDKEFER